VVESGKQLLPTTATAEDVTGTVAATVVICAYTLTRWSETRAAVASVFGQKPVPAEVILIIDHNAELLSLARSELGDVTVIESAGAPGLSGARNTGHSLLGR
jgi:hypothetical protein